MPRFPFARCATHRGCRGERETRGLGMSELSNVYSSHHDDISGATESQDAAAEAANPSSQPQDPSEGMSTLPGQALGK